MYALSNIKHNGNMYFRGDSVPELTAKQVEKLVSLGIVSETKPDTETQESNVSRVISEEERRANRAGKPVKATKEETAPEAPSAPAGYESMTNKQLGELLASRGLETTGNKKELIARLVESDKEEPEGGIANADEL
jgi:hypothetical protein